MSRKITSILMKRAVEELFNHEVARNGKVSSHSQLERWIVEELKMYNAPDSAKALQLVLRDIRGIHFDLESPTIDHKVDAEVRMRLEYNKHGFVMENTGGGCTCFSFTNNGADYEVMVTNNEGVDAPDDLLVPVLCGLYDGGGNILVSQVYASSFEMFGSDFFKWLVNHS